MNTLFIVALWAVGYLAVARGWFLLLLSTQINDFGDADNSDVGFAIILSAIIAVFWPISGTGLALFIAARHILTFGGERTLADWANGLVKR